ncbi:MAG: chemotaxis protein CheX [Rhodocyclaceae bacterium]|jgi:chemotaxis protein CheX|nr:chemotaxis protein CheX [Rhodocyclaceae bacterium]
MDETQLKVFVGIVQRYFEKITGKAAEVGTPFLGQPKELPIHDFTGVIGISGSQRGCVYFSAPAQMLKELLLRAGETDLSEDNFADLTGEIANTISGNARREFGSEFLISVPVVVRGSGQHITVPKDVRAYVIPLRWHKIAASLVVSVAKA